MKSCTLPPRLAALTSRHVLAMCVACAGVLATTSSALAQESHLLEETIGSGSEEERVGGFQVGVHMLYGAVRAHETRHDHLGFGLFGEHALGHHLKLEWAGHVARQELDTEFTEAVSVRLPWHATLHAELFVGVGGLVRQHTEGERFSGGLFAVAGGAYWFGPREHWALSVEVELIDDLTRATQEVDCLAGFVYRFGDDAHTL